MKKDAPHHPVQAPCMASVDAPVDASLGWRARLVQRLRALHAWLVRAEERITATFRVPPNGG